MKIVEHGGTAEQNKIVGFENIDGDDGEDVDGTMKEYVEENLGGMAGRRSSMRVNSLLYEEDSM